jgi:membrane associated rhomboid family serine protease
VSVNEWHHKKSLDHPWSRRLRADLVFIGQAIRLHTILRSRCIREKSPLATAFVATPAVCVIIAANLVVFGLWQEAKARQDVHFYRQIHNLFVVPYHKEERRQRPHTVLLSGFSYSKFAHLCLNLFALHLFGSTLEPLMGSRKFVYLYICSIYASKFLDFKIFEKIDAFLEKLYGSKLKIVQKIDGFIAALTKLIDSATDSYEIPDRLQPNKKRRSRLNGGGHGASGAVSGLSIYYCLSFPNQGFLFLQAAVEMPARSAILVWIAQDILQQGRTNIGHGVHLGGYMFGGLIWLLDRIFIGPAKDCRYFEI